MTLSRALLLAASALLGSSCAVLPARERVPAATPVAASAIASSVTVSDQRGDLSSSAAKRAVQGIAAEGKGDLALHHLSVLAAQGGAQLYHGNAAQLLVDGPQTLGAMRTAIQGATQRVLLETYIFEDEGLAKEMGELLVRKAGEGVKVALMYDSVGSIGATPEFFEQLRAGGVAVCQFNPINPLHRPGYWGINHRDHRKILLVDDRIAFTGGINISQVYSSGSSSLRRKAVSEQEALKNGWRDTQVSLRGPVAAAFATAFEEHWTSQGCKGSLGTPAANPPANAGPRTVQLLLSHPQDERNRIYDSLLKAIDASQRSVHLTMAYFAPGDDMAQALCDAAQRNVDVVLILPSRSDFTLMLAAGRAYYQRLLDCGVKIHEMQDAMLHAKTAVIDGVWSTVGSSNLDWRSFVTNSEVNVVVLGDDFGQSLEQLFQRDLAASSPVRPEEWAQRGIGARVKEQVGRIVERLL